MSQELVHKATLSSGKTVLFKPMEMKYEELAAQAASQKAGDNQSMLAYFMQSELLKILVVAVDDKTLGASDKELLDKYLSYQDLTQCRTVVAKLMGEATAQEPQIEIVSGGQA